MAVAAVKEYQFAPADSMDKFHGNQLLYIGWEDHLLFCAPFAFPFPPTMRFGDIIAGVLPGVLLAALFSAMGVLGERLLDQPWLYRG